MKSIIACSVCICCLAACEGQATFGTDLLKLERKIEMPSVKGRIDHMAINLKENVLYVAALGNNTVEVVDLKKWSVIHSIKGVAEPQGVAYIAEQNEIAVASGSTGDCVFYNASTFDKVATIRLGSDADNIRYDPTERKMYVGYGEGGIALIDPAAHRQTGDVKLAAHPESFQLDKKNNRLYVNLPDDHSIGVIDLKNFKLVDTWKISRFRSNFPMTLDTAANEVLVGFRHPSVLVAYDIKTGEEITRNELVNDADDIFYDAGKQQVIATGGEGYINVFKKTAGHTWKLVSNVATRDGARTSFLIPALKIFVVAERAGAGKNAAIAVYKMVD